MASLAGALVLAAVGLAASPYLARLTLTVPDGGNARWWRGLPAGRDRVLVTALAAVVLGLFGGAAAGLTALLPAYVTLVLAGAPLVVIDYEHHRLPNRLVYPAGIAGIVLLALAAAVRDEWHDYLRAIEGGVVAYLVLFVLMFISPKSFGWGDVRLGGILGGYLGYLGWTEVYYGVFAGFLLGSVVAIVLIASRRATMKSAIAFGPMLLLGAFVVLAFDLAPALTS